MQYRPCRVTLEDGTKQDFVYICEADPWFQYWGVDPEDDSGKDSVPIERVRAIDESPSRLPARFADVMYQAGESRMGGCTFQLLLRDGRRLNCETGNAVDFLLWPGDVSPADVVELLPHSAGADGQGVSDAPYAWCLYEVNDR